jgi:hypothetical protein
VILPFFVSTFFEARGKSRHRQGRRRAAFDGIKRTPDFI